MITRMTYSSPPCLAVLWWDPGPDRVLDGLNLYGQCRQHGLLQTVELIKAAPGTALDQINEDATHGLDVQTPESGRIGRDKYIAVRENGTCIATYTETIQVVVLYNYLNSTGCYALHLTVKLHSSTPHVIGLFDDRGPLLCMTQNKTSSTSAYVPHHS